MKKLTIQNDEKVQGMYPGLWTKEMSSFNPIATIKLYTNENPK